VVSKTATASCTARDCSDCPDKQTEGDSVQVKHSVVSGRCTAVTSINPDPSRQQRQEECLKSWVAAGMNIVAVNQSNEFDSMPWLSSIAKQCISGEIAVGYDRPVQKVVALLRAGILTGGAFMVINSDIQVIGDVSPLNAALKMADRLTIGVRWNHDKAAGVQTARLEAAGLDVFLMTPELAATVEDIGLGIGKPTWDYWLPHHFRSLGVKFNWVQRPLFFHESHPVGWSSMEWDRGHKTILDSCGVSISGDFRRTLHR